MSSSSATNSSAAFAGSAASPALPIAVSRGRLWTGRVLTTLTVLFMLFDAIGKLIRPAPAPIADAFARLGFPLPLASSIAILLLVSTILYAVPRTTVLGAVLLTGYLGGAVAIQLRAGSSFFENALSRHLRSTCNTVVDLIFAIHKSAAHLPLNSKRGRRAEITIEQRSHSGCESFSQFGAGNSGQGW